MAKPVSVMVSAVVVSYNTRCLLHHSVQQISESLDGIPHEVTIHFVLRLDFFDNRGYDVVTDNASVRQILDAIRVEVGDIDVQYVDTRIMNQLSYSVSAERFIQAGFRFHGSLNAGIG
ncbi:MAG: hypothetical protein V3S94_07720 [Gammaproteobacteria bacterium]